jgi:hypothetical protein
MGLVFRLCTVVVTLRQSESRRDLPQDVGFCARDELVCGGQGHEHFENLDPQFQVGQFTQDPAVARGLGRGNLDDMALERGGELSAWRKRSRVRVILSTRTATPLAD